MTEWISVDDKLPEFECSVLCYRESDDWQVVADYFYPAFWIDFSEGKIAHAITHWQPLPEPPKD